MAELDHIVFACKDLDQGTKMIRDITGAEPVPGGPHRIMLDSLPAATMRPIAPSGPVR